MPLSPISPNVKLAAEQPTEKPRMATTTMNSPPASSPPCSTDPASGAPAQQSPLPSTSTPATASPVTAMPPDSTAPNPSPAKKQAGNTKKRKLSPEEEQKKKELEATREAKRQKKKAEDAIKEAKKKEKQEQEEAAQAKREKQQHLMANFLKKPPTTPKKQNPPAIQVEIDTASPRAEKGKQQSSKCAYDIAFQPFFIKPDVTLAHPPSEMDEETKEAKSRILDEYINGARGEFVPAQPFNAVETFDLAFPQRRGIIPPSVQKIMSTIHGDSYDALLGTEKPRTESQTEKLYINAQDRLNAVPMKYLRFFEDVRPAYYGTMTTYMPYQKLRKLSRNPAAKVLPKLLQYDYDSEAEWVEEDGEDLEDAEDDEEDLDGDEEMDDFVDDSEAVQTIIRPGFEADSVPVSTGICYENSKRLGPSCTPYKYRMEILLDTLEHHSLIDPFSTSYWPSSTSTVQGTAKSVQAPAMSKGAAGLSSSKPATSNANLVPPSVLAEIKQALVSEECREFSKLTVVELLAKKFSSCTKAQVKATIDTIAHRVTPSGEKKSVKHWVLLPGHELKGV